MKMPNNLLYFRCIVYESMVKLLNFKTNIFHAKMKEKYAKMHTLEDV